MMVYGVSSDSYVQYTSFKNGYRFSTSGTLYSRFTIYSGTLPMTTRTWTVKLKMASYFPSAFIRVLPFRQICSHPMSEAIIVHGVLLKTTNLGAAAVVSALFEFNRKATLVPAVSAINYVRPMLNSLQQGKALVSVSLFSR